MRKRLLTFLCLCLLAGICSGCGSSSADASCRDIVKACASEEGVLDAMTAYGEDLYSDSFDTLYGIQYDMIDDGAILYTEKGGKADEISILHLKKNEDISIAKQKLEDRIQERRHVFANYKPAEVSKLDNARVMVQGDYVALIIADDSQKYETEIRKTITEGEH